MKDPVSEISRPVNTAESWAAYDFEMHARNCVYCHNPYEVHRDHRQLCDVGHRLAQGVAHFIYNGVDGMTYSQFEEDHKLVRVEMPPSYGEVRGLLKAIERSVRHRSRVPFVSQDRTYYVAPRGVAPQRTKSVKLDQAPKIKSKPRPRSGEIVDWPSSPKPKAPLAEISSSISNAKRGSLYEQDLAMERRNAQKYAVEVREPSMSDVRNHRLSGYYR